MKKQLVSRRDFIQGSSTAGLMLVGSALGADPPAYGSPSPVAAEARAGQSSAPGISGQGHMKFRVLRTSDSLPEAAQKVVIKAHGGFAVDRRPGKGETYFALPGAGILQISADLKAIRLLKTAESMKKVNLHDTTIWNDPEDGAAYLAFPANDAGKIFTTALDGTLLSTLDAPSPAQGFEQPEVHDYFLGGGNFAPTGVTCLDGLYYITTGYCGLDFVLTSRISSPSHVVWNDLAFGGRGDEYNQFRTAHAVTVYPGAKQLAISDRKHSAIKRFTRYGHYLSTLRMPMGCLPCSIDYLDGYAVVPTLEGPDPGKGAPIYIFQGDQLISAIFPKAELGLKNFQHNHKAVLTKVDSKFYIIVQAWNPGDFAILEQVTG
ncbi:MAG: twin-arginine translocation signal domain-containing protein [Terriglobia bacterium]